MIKLVIGMFVGLAGHQGHTVLESWQSAGTPKPWILIARYIVGVIITLPVFLLFKRKGRNDTDDDIAAFLLSFLSVGMGTTVGHLLDGLK